MEVDDHRALGADVTYLSDVLRRNLAQLRAEAPETAASAVAMIAEARALGRAQRAEECRATLKECERLLQPLIKRRPGITRGDG